MISLLFIHIPYFIVLLNFHLLTYIHIFMIYLPYIQHLRFVSKYTYTRGVHIYMNVCVFCKWETEYKLSFIKIIKK